MAKTDDDIIVCRCEDVTLGEIRRAIAEGATTIDEIRRITRAGMGPCQGRTCANSCFRAGRRPASRRRACLPVRPPMKPITMGSPPRSGGGWE